VKVDLFPDSVYVFTPKSKIIALPRGATALDFAYTIHTDVGDQTIAVKINLEQVPLRTELRNGDIVEIITSPSSRPNPNWLNFVRTGKARSAIRHYLRTINLTESIELGRKLLAQALSALNLNPELPAAVTERLLNESSAKSIDDLHADIGVGKRMAALVARHILGMLENDQPLPHPLIDLNGEIVPKKIDPVVIYGSEGISVQLAPCCQPIPGDDIIGQMKRDQGLTIHTLECDVVRRQRSKEPDRWIDVIWGADIDRRFDCGITLLARNEKGILARVAAEISESDSNITLVGMDEDKEHMITYLHFTIQVEDRVHLARLMRNLRAIPGVTRLLRHKGGS
jgi:GTP pyrophosphokinase